LIDWFAPELLAFIAAAAFGAAVVASKVGLREMSPLGGATVSVPTTALLLWCLAPLFLDASGWNNDAALIFALIGLFFPALVTLLNFEANSRMGPIVASTVASVTPLFAVAGAIVLLGETPTLRAALGIAAVVLGVMTLSVSGRGVRRDWPLWVVLIPLAGAMVRGSAQALAKFGLALWPSWFAAALIGYTVSAAIILMFAFGPGRSRRSAYRENAVFWFALAGALNGAAVLLMYAALNSGTVTVVASIIAVYPAFTLLLSALFLHDEKITSFVLAGMILTLAGIILVMQG